MVTTEQYLNRLIEWVPKERMAEAMAVYYDIVDHGFPPEEAFEMVINL